MEWYRSEWQQEKEFLDRLETSRDPSQVSVYEEVSQRNKLPRTSLATYRADVMELPDTVKFDELKVITHKLSVVGVGGLPWEPKNGTRKQLELSIHGHQSPVSLRKYVDFKTLAYNMEGNEVAITDALLQRGKALRLNADRVRDFLFHHRMVIRSRRWGGQASP